MKRLTTGVPLVLVLASLAASHASASPVRLAGIQSPPDTTAGHPQDLCRASDPRTGRAPALSNTMAGSLIGCWYTDTFNQVMTKANGEILAIGNEHFVGCLDTNRDRKCARRDPHGTLALVYAFEGRFDTAGNEIRGQCQHPILSGTGDFTGAQGRLDFKDDVATGHATYRGQLTLAQHSRRARATPSVGRRSLASAC